MYEDKKEILNKFNNNLINKIQQKKNKNNNDTDTNELNLTLDTIKTNLELTNNIELELIDTLSEMENKANALEELDTELEEKIKNVIQKFSNLKKTKIKDIDISINELEYYQETCEGLIMQITQYNYIGQEIDKIIEEIEYDTPERGNGEGGDWGDVDPTDDIDDWDGFDPADD